MTNLRANFFGAPRLEREGKPVVVNTRKAIALFAYLVVTARRHRRETLAALFWSDEKPTHARGALRNTLYELNKALGGVGLDITREDVSFVPAASLVIDVVEFKSQLDAPRTHGHAPEVICHACLEAFARAAALYRDDFLAGFNLDTSPEFEDWQRLQTESFRRELASVLERSSRGQRARGNFPTALEYAQRWLSLDRLDEAANRRVMELFALAGQRAAALETFRELVERTQNELHSAPQTETVELYEAIKTNRFASLPASPTVGNLTAHLPSTPFVGREEELARLGQWLDEADAPLLTIVGAGGIGKTRLALHCALTYATRFKDGAYFVPLAPVTSELLVSAMAQSLDLVFQTRYDSTTQLLNFLRDKNLLLVLDNFEHVKSQAALLSKIVSRARHVKMLVTSREWLSLPEEQVLDLEGLPYPEVSAPQSQAKETNTSAATQLEEYEAVQLFVQNARRVNWSFRLEHEARGVERVCQLVEGMPLGIELAAAWARVISCEEIAREIERDLGILTLTLGGTPERHRSLRVVFDYSYSRLAPEVQAVFRRLSVFHGGANREAAERVAGASLSTLATLVDHSLVRRTARGRYELHELLRRYAEELLSAAEEPTSALLDAHTSYYAEFLQQRQAELKGKQQREALEAIAEEIDNVRAAWQRAVSRRRADDLAKAFESLFIFFRIRSQFKEGAQAFARAAEAIEESGDNVLRAELCTRQATFLELLGDFDTARALLESNLGPLPSTSRAFALVELGVVAFRQGHLTEARDYWQEALSLSRAANDTRGVALALRWLGEIASDLEGDFRASERFSRESLALFRALDDQRSTASLLTSLGIKLGDLGEYDDARRVLEESTLIYRELGDRYGVALNLNNLGVLARARGEYPDAWKFFQDSLVIRREVGDRFAIALALANLGKTAVFLERYDEAQQILDESLALHREIGDHIHIANTLTKVGMLATRRGNVQRARAAFLEALQIAKDRGSKPMMLEILAEIAALWMTREAERAVELAALVLDHPGTDQAAKNNAARVLQDAQAKLNADIIAKARARARQRELEEVVNEQLTKLERLTD